MTLAWIRKNYRVPAKRGHIERDGLMIRMTDAGRAALTATTSHKTEPQ